MATFIDAPRPLEPVLLVDRFAPLHAELISLLRGLQPPDWDRPTACSLWAVRDIAAHLLDDDLRRLSSHRDGHQLSGAPVNSLRDLIAMIDRLNAEWVAASRRLSPRVLIELLEVTGPEVVALFRSIDPFAPAHWAVSWAGETQSAHWFDVGRDYTERWLHQQQIREAVGAPPITSRLWLRPVLDLFVRALPFTYRDTQREPGTTVHLSIQGEAGGDWTLRRDPAAWTLLAGVLSAPDARLEMSDDTAWRLLSKGLKPAAARHRVTIQGDQALAEVALGSLGIMG
jgi:uncharacterized protein (TIGR03083 family)